MIWNSCYLNRLVKAYYHKWLADIIHATGVFWFFVYAFLSNLQQPLINRRLKAKRFFIKKFFTKSLAINYWLCQKALKLSINVLKELLRIR